VDVESTRGRQVWSLLLDDACRRVAQHLTAAGQPFLMLKGATIATWLYDDPLARTYSDLDLLVPPADQDAVVVLLGQMGYEPLLDAASLAVISPEEQPLRDRHGVMIDLHVAIKGIRLPPERAWDVLHARSVPWVWAGTTVPALDLTARTMHLPLHVAQRGVEDSKALRDLELGLLRLPDASWAAAADLARELDALETFTAGLGLVPAGVELIDRLRLPQPSDVAVLMSADSSVFRPAIALEQMLATTGSWSQRLRMAWVYLFPSAGWLRQRDPRAGTSGTSMVLARIRRPFRILARAAVAYRTRRRFRRERPGA
jgi:hypothetical protein